MFSVQKMKSADKVSILAEIGNITFVSILLRKAQTNLWSVILLVDLAMFLSIAIDRKNAWEQLTIHSYLPGQEQ